jgi:hypothetical protein
MGSHEDDEQIHELERIIALKSREGTLNLNQITDILREKSGTFSEPEALLQMIQAVILERTGRKK